MEATGVSLVEVVRQELGGAIPFLAKAVMEAEEPEVVAVPEVVVAIHLFTNNLVLAEPGDLAEGAEDLSQWELIES
jgi:hypothetical protein